MYIVSAPRRTFELTQLFLVTTMIEMIVVDIYYDATSVIDENIQKTVNLFDLDHSIISLGIDYPPKRNYPDEKDCLWTVKRSATFSIRFVRLDLERDDRCRYDFVEIGGRRFCETILWKNFKSTGNHLNIRFHLDASTNKRGFKIRVEPRLYKR